MWLDRYLGPSSYLTLLDAKRLRPTVAPSDRSVTFLNIKCHSCLQNNKRNSYLTALIPVYFSQVDQVDFFSRLNDDRIKRRRTATQR